MFEREARREKILEARQRELKLKERERSGKGVREDEESKRKYILQLNPLIRFFTKEKVQSCDLMVKYLFFFFKSQIHKFAPNVVSI